MSSEHNRQALLHKSRGYIQGLPAAAVAVVAGAAAGPIAADDMEGPGVVAALQSLLCYQAYHTQADRSSACCVYGRGLESQPATTRAGSKHSKRRSSAENTAKVWGNRHLLYLECRYRKNGSSMRAMRLRAEARHVRTLMWFGPATGTCARGFLSSRSARLTLPAS